MAPRTNPHLSITLPRNFTFHYTDSAPKTPERPQQQTEDQSPPGPPVFRVRRRARAPLPDSQPGWLSQSAQKPEDVPIPTIEVPDYTVDSNPFAMTAVYPPAPLEGFLAPAVSLPRSFLSPPKTPIQPVPSFLDHDDGGIFNWGPNPDLASIESISRPSSRCSTFSNSSQSSCESTITFPSLGGSCTSPESDLQDPFVTSTAEKGEQESYSVLGRKTIRRQKTKTLTKKHTQWTADMDNHLWTTYLLYLQDPTVTPFKMPPGGIPPLGICHRVAREAKRSWKGLKAPANHHNGNEGSQMAVPKQGDADYSSASKESKSGSTTPTGLQVPKPHVGWPRSEASTRRRLRELCKRRPTLTPYYSRLLMSRSPSPFFRSSSRARSPRHSSTFGGQSFSTRGMALSLATSTSQTMQPTGALVTLTRDETPKHANDLSIDSVLEHDQPTQQGLGINGVGGLENRSRVTTPLAQRDPSPERSTSAEDDHEAVRQEPLLKSPLQLQAPLAFSSLKRRAPHQLEDELSPGGSDKRNNFLEDLFGAPAESSHRRVRSRGFSFGDATMGSRVPSLVTPPTMFDQMNSTEFAATATFESTAPALSQARRLGSPFAGLEASPNSSTSAGHSRHTSFNTFPRLSNGIDFASFEQRFAALDSDGDQNMKRSR